MKHRILRIGEDVRDIGMISDSHPYETVWRNQATLIDKELFENSFSRPFLVRFGKIGTLELEDGREAHFNGTVDEEVEPEDPRFFPALVSHLQNKGYFITAPREG